MSRHASIIIIPYPLWFTKPQSAIGTYVEVKDEGGRLIVRLVWDGERYVTNQQVYQAQDAEDHF